MLTSTYDYRNLETAAVTNTLSNAVNPITTAYNVLFNPITYQTNSTTKYTIASATTLSILGAPIASTTSLALTNSIGAYISGGALNASTTNGIGLQVVAPSGAVNNYAALFTGGNLGIGTTTPQALLSVQGTSGNLIQAFNGATSMFSVASNGGVSAASYLLAGSSAAGANGQLYLYNSGSVDTVTINSSGNSYLNGGNIGIGTTTPGYQLVVASSSTTQPTLYVVGTSSQTSNLFVVASSSGASYLSVLANGNVGIGTSTPSQALVVNGQVQITGGSPALGSVLESDANGVGSWVATSTLGITGSGTNYFTLSGNALFNNTGYQVGINSSTPTANLVVEGSSTAPTLPILSVASSSNQSYLTVLANGNIGIGTSSPSYPLTVAGNGLLTGHLALGNSAILDNTPSWSGVGPQPSVLSVADNVVGALTDGGNYSDINDFSQYNNTSSTTSPNINALDIEPYLSDSFSGAVNTFTAVNGSVVDNGTGTVSTLTGGNFTATNNASSSINFIYGVNALAQSSDDQSVYRQIVGANAQAVVQGNAGSGVGGQFQAFMYGDNYDLPSLTGLYTKVSVEGSANTTTQTTGLDVDSPQVYSPLTNNYGIYIADQTAGVQSYITLSSNYQFYSAGANPFVITAGGGNVGIGTTTPAYQLSVISGSTTTPTALIMATSSQTSNILVVASSSGISYLTVASNGSTTLSSLGTGCVASASGSLYTTGCGGTNYWTNSSNILFNNTGYQVGINSTTPTANLVVEGSSTAPTLPILTVASSSNASYFYSIG